ncbi:thiol-disulfide oxidoreductase DCC family protein [Chungangia koreensis]|uniref:Thiol-disulfide oxidoreductase DCC family protein n=1 Tax=Chungangia koreensis TaxID=752657 RepID=A0ABV8X9E8_9LACT
MERIVLFDGVCNFCNSSVQFIINRDPAGKIQFASQQSVVGENLMAAHGITGNDSMVYIEDGQAYTKSTAALRIAKHLTMPWSICSVLTILPLPIRDSIYSLIAKYRYRWFGKRDSCMIPPPSIRNRFLHD